MSRVTAITPFPVCYPEPNDGDNLRYLVFVRVESDDGTVGWGEAITQFPEATRATTVLLEGIESLVVGSDPMQNVATWRRIKAATWWYGYRGGPAAFALSAIDIALWDLKGKLLGQPLINLIGGAHREQVPALRRRTRSTPASNTRPSVTVATSVTRATSASRSGWASAATRGWDTSSPGISSSWGCCERRSDPTR